ncbi:GNAT family N-acetyltransferase [Propionibacteriaceae bacterium Y1700]|uniref:GNAT family N-acetyltransferase n=1 Tax=Microlunatus sp. Y1700 TaxID=3418487 RepID=UPI003DA7529B
MRTSRIRSIGPGDLDQLPACSGGCPDASLLADDGWIKPTMERFGTLGVRVVDHEMPVGHLLLAAPDTRPVQGIWSTTALSHDAALVIMVRVVDHERGHGIGRQLVQSAAAQAMRGRVAALEAIGSYGAGTCATPAVTWLRRTGFQVTRNHPLTPRLRLDLHSTLPLPRLRQALAALQNLIRPYPPEPVGRSEPAQRLDGDHIEAKS